MVVVKGDVEINQIVVSGGRHDIVHVVLLNVKIVTCASPRCATIFLGGTLINDETFSPPRAHGFDISTSGKLLILRRAGITFARRTSGDDGKEPLAIPGTRVE